MLSRADAGRRRADARCSCCRARPRPSTWPCAELILPELAHLVGQLRRRHGASGATRALSELDAPRSAAGRPASSASIDYAARLGDGPLQLPLHLLHARRRRRARRARRDRCRSRRSPPWCACFVGLGVRRVRLTGGEPTVRRDLPALVRLLRADRRARRAGAVDQRAPAGRAGRAAARGGRRSPERQPRFAATPTVSRASPAAAIWRACWPASTPRAPPASPHQDQHRRDRRLQRRRARARSAPTPGRAAWCRASSSRCRWRPARCSCPGALLAAAEIRARVAAALRAARVWSPTTAARPRRRARRATSGW